MRFGTISFVVLTVFVCCNVIKSCIWIVCSRLSARYFVLLLSLLIQIVLFIYFLYTSRLVANRTFYVALLRLIGFCFLFVWVIEKNWDFNEKIQWYFMARKLFSIFFPNDILTIEWIYVTCFLLFEMCN